MSGWDLGAFLRAAVALGISSFLKFSGDVSPEVGPALLPLIAKMMAKKIRKGRLFIFNNREY